MPEAATSIEPAGNVLSLKPGTLRSFAEIVGRFPFPEGTTFGVIGKPERPIALGYTPKQLGGVLHRLDDELAKGNDAKLFDKPHWQLAALEAVQAMSGPLAQSVQEALNVQKELLQKQVLEQRGLKIFSPIGKQEPVEKSIVADQTEVEKQARQTLADLLFQNIRDIAHAQKNPKVIVTEFIAAACTACAGFGGGTIPTAEAPTAATNPAITLTVEPPTQEPTATAYSPAETPTPESTATPDMSRFILSATNPTPDSPLQAPIGEKADVATIIAQLHRGPSLLSPDAEPVEVGNIVDRGGGQKVFNIVCNIDSKSCAPAALLKYSDVYKGLEYTDIVVLILEIKIKSTELSPDGRGYIARVVNIPEWPKTGEYNFWRQHPTNLHYVECTTAIAPEYQQFLPYRDALTQETQQPGFGSATDALVTNGDTSALEAAGIVFP